MKRFTGGILLIHLIFTMILPGCNKDSGENYDYLNLYTGSFTFSIIKHHVIWISNYDTTYTKTIGGSIVKYSGSLSNSYRRLTIDFGNTIEPEVLKNGDFVEERRGGADYYLSGQFINRDEVWFELR